MSPPITASTYILIYFAFKGVSITQPRNGALGFQPGTPHKRNIFGGNMKKALIKKEMPLYIIKNDKKIIVNQDNLL